MSKVKKCRKCGEDLIVGENWKPSRVKKYDYCCNTCFRLYGYKGNKETIKLQKRRYQARKRASKSFIKQYKEEIDYIYKQAKEIEKTTGISQHVDHIIPLNHSDVCGLHVPWNLQIIPAIENIKKSNKFEIIRK